MTAPRLILKPDIRTPISRLGRLISFLAGFAVGVAIALTLAWDIITPAPIVGSIASLRARDKEGYIVLVSMSYALDSDLVMAERRLSLLGDQNIQGTLRDLTERYTNELRPQAQRSSVAKLALALGADSVTLRVYVNTTTPAAGRVADGTPGAPAQASVQARALNATPAPPARPTATPARLDYRLYESLRLTCQQETGPKPHIAIFVQDASGKGIPGVRVRVQWNDGEDTFFTGLKSAEPGYAEYEVQPGKSYSVSVQDGTSQTALGLSADALDSTCPSDGKDHFRAWRVIFRRVG